MVSRVTQRLFKLIYEKAGKPWPSDNLCDVIVRAGKGDKSKKPPEEGYRIIPDALEAGPHAVRILANKLRHDDDQYKMGVVEAELCLNAILMVLQWFYCESGLVTKLPSLYRGLGDLAPSPQTPDFYAHPHYILTSAFVGRRAELAMLHEWAASTDSVMVVQAIPGVGKSALTWEWFRQRAPATLPGLVGRLWWSFSERETSLATFLRHGLAYVTRQDLNTLPTQDPEDCAQRLLAELRRRPYLLVLDGFERMLAGYHVQDQSQLPDQPVPLDKYECINPADRRVLEQLVSLGPSKLLVNTRLMPTVLKDEYLDRPILGVRRMELQGLSAKDALELIGNAGVRGDRREILQFANRFGRHALVLRVVCGMILKHRRAPGNFKAWWNDRLGGAALRLRDLKFAQAHNHILDFAFRGMDEPSRRLLSRIAVLNGSADYLTLSAINPFLPPSPTVLPEPDNSFVFQAQRVFARLLTWAKTDQERTEVAAERDRTLGELEAAYQASQQAYEQYLRDVQRYQASPAYRQAIQDFDQALSDLEARGLLQWDKHNTYDLHPVVREIASEHLEDHDRTRTFEAIGDHFASLPPDRVNEATELAHVKNSLEVVRALIGAGHLTDAVRVYSGELSNALLFSIGAFQIIIDLMGPLTGTNRDGIPLLPDPVTRSYIMNHVALAFDSLGRFEEAIPLYRDKLRLNLESNRWKEVTIGLRNWAGCNWGLNRLALGVRAEELACELASVVGDVDGYTVSLVYRMVNAVSLGQFAQADNLHKAFLERNRPPRASYQPGTVEYWVALSHFYQNQLTADELTAGEQLVQSERNLLRQHEFATLRAEWELQRGQSGAALAAIEEAIAIVRRTGRSSPDHLGIRALALARAGRSAAALETLQEAVEVWDGTHARFPLFAAQTWFELGDANKARTHVLRFYPLAWADGPPYVRWYELNCCRELMAQLNVPEPQMSKFDPSQVALIPFESEIRAAIARLNAARGGNPTP